MLFLPLEMPLCHKINLGLQTQMRDILMAILSIMFWDGTLHICLLMDKPNRCLADILEMYFFQINWDENIK